ncbi:ABC transporter ATP-binding protein [Gracilibacillus sp. Marseille-QA3620]
MNDFVLTTRKLTKVFGNQLAVNDVNIHVKPGHIYGLIGRNGSGKTTIMKMVLGLSKKTDGEILIFGKAPERNAHEVYHRIGSTIETPGFYPNMTARENLEVFASLRGTIDGQSIRKALHTVELPYEDKKHFSQYSLGMKQRLGIANAIMHNPDILILDEPANGLDPIGIADIRNLIKSLSRDYGKTILISSHQLTEMEQMITQVGFIHNGKLLKECDYEDLLKRRGSYISVKTSDIKKACAILRQQLNIDDYSAKDNGVVEIFDLTHDPSAINRALIMAEVDVSAIGLKTNGLEKYFSSLIGSGEHA